MAIEDTSVAADLLGLLRDAHGDAVTTYEYMQRPCFEMVFAHIPGAREPLESIYKHYLLIEIGASSIGGDMQNRFEETLAHGFDKGWILDASVAKSEAQREDFWRLRENITEATKLAGVSIKHDISVALTDVATFVARGSAALAEMLPTGKLIVFGHLGDGNLHFNLNQPDGMGANEFLERSAEVSRVVHDIVVELGGSFSAEHGIGRIKRKDMAAYKSVVELDLMRRIKRTLDPKGLLNPDHVLP